MASKGNREFLITTAISAEQLLREALVRSPIPAVLIDCSDRVVFANKPACAIFGLTPGDDGWDRSEMEESELEAIDIRLRSRVDSGREGWHQLGVADFGSESGEVAGMRVWATLGDDLSNPEGVALTKREREILGLVAGGLRTDEIAGHLTVSPETVKSHVHNAMQKLRAHTRSQAVAIAISTGQVSYNGTGAASN